MKRTLHLLLAASLVGLGGQAQTLTNVSSMTHKLSFANDKEIMGKLHIAAAAVAGSSSAAEVANWKSAAEYARKNTTQLVKNLSAFNSTDGPQPDVSSPISEIRVTSYVLLALKAKSGKSTSDITQYFTSYNVNARDQATIWGYINAIFDLAPTLVPPTVSIFAAGDVAGSVGSSATGGSQNTSASGSVGIQFVNARDIVSARILVASTLDTLKSNFGQSLLNPAKGKAIGSGILEWYHRLDWPFAWNPWLHVYASAASVTWGVDTSSTNGVYRSASVTGLGALFSWDLFKGNVASTPVALSLELGASLRSIGGDVRSLLKKGSSDSASYIKAFPSAKSTFIGPELGLSIHVGDVTAALQAYLYSKGSKDRIDGLTGLQFSFGISINASVISGALQ